MKTLMGPKKFEVKSDLGSEENFGSKKKSGLKYILDPKKCFDQKKL